MKNIYLIIILLICQEFVLASVPYGQEAELFLKILDSYIKQEDELLLQKETRITSLEIQKRKAITPENIYFYNKLLFDEYSVFNADSALKFMQENKRIAYQTKNKEWLAECHIKEGGVLSSAGLLKEALDTLNLVNSEKLPLNFKTEYFGRMITLYSHLAQYTGEASLSRYYYDMQAVYSDSIMQVIPETDPYYLWYKGWNLYGPPVSRDFIAVYETVVNNSEMEGRLDAMNAYFLYFIARQEGRMDDCIRYLAMSGIADVKMLNRDVASLQELSDIMFQYGELDRAYNYINYCLKAAQAYPNRIRIMEIARLQDQINRAFLERNVQQERKLKHYLWITIFSLLILGGLLFIVFRQMRKLAYSKTKLNETNQLLNIHVEELSFIQKQLAEANERLEHLNFELQETNRKLVESNFIKEEYIGYVFNICSNYIGKLDEFRKNISRKIKTGLIKEIHELTDSGAFVSSELKDFYRNFDAVFLNIYPDFVSDFNSLLQPEEQIVLKEGELLNTELRIYALVRLGITDSTRIAEFLHVSPQTIYNNRVRTRNKAVLPKDKFVDTVKSLGKIQPKNYREIN